MSVTCKGFDMCNMVHGLAYVLCVCAMCTSLAYVLCVCTMCMCYVIPMVYIHAHALDIAPICSTLVHALAHVRVHAHAHTLDIPHQILQYYNILQCIYNIAVYKHPCN